MKNPAIEIITSDIVRKDYVDHMYKKGHYTKKLLNRKIVQNGVRKRIKLGRLYKKQLT